MGSLEVSSRHQETASDGLEWGMDKNKVGFVCLFF